MLPSSASRIAASSAVGLSASSCTADITMPGVQKPHCRPWHSRNAACIGCISAPVARPSIVVISLPCTCNASFNKSDQSYTLYVANQNPHVERLLMCAFVLSLPESKVRVIAPDVGGGFGSKIFLYPEDVALVWASKHVGRPIKWTAERSESFLTDAHGRDHLTTAEMAMDAQGN